MFINILYCFCWVPLLFVRLLAILIGFIWIPLCLVGLKLPRDVSEWELIRLPWYGHPWDNPRDGALGDRRLDYWSNGKQYPKFFDSLPLHQYIKAYYWLAIRNPANNLSRYYRGFGCKVDDCDIELLAGQEFVSDTKEVHGYQFVKATGPVFSYWGFYLFKPISEGKYLMIRVGHKIEPRYADDVFEGDRSSKAWKGFTFRISIRGERK